VETAGELGVKFTFSFLVYLFLLFQEDERREELCLRAASLWQESSFPDLGRKLAVSDTT
jgi:hypothetical protein